MQKRKVSYTSTEKILDIDIDKYNLISLINNTVGEGSEKATTSLPTADMKRYNSKLNRYLDIIDNHDDSFNKWFL